MPGTQGMSRRLAQSRAFVIGGRGVPVGDVQQSLTRPADEEDMAFTEELQVERAERDEVKWLERQGWAVREQRLDYCGSEIEAEEMKEWARKDGEGKSRMTEGKNIRDWLTKGG